MSCDQNPNFSQDNLFAYMKAQGGCKVDELDMCPQQQANWPGKKTGHPCCDKLINAYNASMGCDGSQGTGFSPEDDDNCPEGVVCTLANPSMERYDPNSNVCGNQADFNQALQAAIKSNRTQKMTPVMWVVLVLYLALLVWGVMLALKVTSGDNRTLHIVLSVAFAPVYVLAYYLGMMKQN